MSAPWGAPGPWQQPPGQPPPWQPPPWQPQTWQPQPPPWQPQPWQWPPPPLPPVVAARYAPGGREEATDGAPPPRWPWLLVSVVAALVLVAGVVVALVLAGTSPAPEAAAPRPAAAAEPLLYGASKRPVRLDSLPGAPRLDPALTWDQAVTSGPDGAAASTALRFVQAVRALDWTTVYGLCAPEVRAAARARAGQLATDAPTVVGAAFYGDELRGQAVAGGSLVAVEPFPAEYLVTFRLQLADAAVASVTLWVSREYTVQDWT